MMRNSRFAIVVIGVLACLVSPAVAQVSDRIDVTVRGQGPDVMLIPGLASSSEVWDATAKRLEGHYRLHIVQVAGFAGLPPKTNGQGAVIQPTVDAIDAYIKANKLKSPRIIGHSIGGLMGMMLADQHPEDVGRLMVVDSLPFFGVLTGASDAAAATPQAAAFRDSIIAETQDAYAQSEREAIPTLVKSPEGCKAVIAWAIASDKSVVARAMYEVRTTDMRPKLKEIRTPITLLYPFDASAGMPQADVDGMYQQSFAPAPNKTLVRIDGSYHFIMLDQPEQFAARVDAFLR